MTSLEELNRELEEKNLLGFWTFVRESAYEPSSFSSHACGNGKTFQALSIRREMFST